MRFWAAPQRIPPFSQPRTRSPPIGDVGLSSRDAISAAREAYDGLSDAQREKVGNADKLTEAEALWEDEYGAKLSQVVSAISAIGKVTLESEAAVSHAESLYNLLSTDEKVLVENRDELFAARKELSKLEEEAAKPKPFAIGDSVDSGKWHVELVDAYTSTEVADANALTSFVSESGTFVVLEFDMLADPGTRDTIDEKVLTDICARWNGQEYRNFDMQYAPGSSSCRLRTPSSTGRERCTFTCSPSFRGKRLATS